MDGYCGTLALSVLYVICDQKSRAIGPFLCYMVVFADVRCFLSPLGLDPWTRMDDNLTLTQPNIDALDSLNPIPELWWIFLLEQSCRFS